jgi:hypothetical protein
MTINEAAMYGLAFGAMLFTMDNLGTRSAICAMAGTTANLF